MKIEEAQAIVARADYHVDINGDMDPELIDAIDTVFQALERTRWIPVSERLPKNHSEILGCYELGLRIVYFNRRVGFHVLDEDCDEIKLNVTHWMPLPNPPEVE